MKIILVYPNLDKIRVVTDMISFEESLNSLLHRIAARYSPNELPTFVINSKEDYERMIKCVLRKEFGKDAEIEIIWTKPPKIPKKVEVMW